jgi:small-conductance mechanosensitive channel
MPCRCRRSLRLLCAALAWSAPAGAQDSAAVQADERPSDAESAVVQPTAPVVVDGVMLFRVRGVSAYPAERRAAEIAERIRAIASDRTFPVESLTVKETPSATTVVAAGRRLFGVLDADAQLEGVPRQVLAETYRDRAAEAVEAFRREREPRVLWRKTANAALVTVVFALALWVGWRAVRRLRAYVDRHRSRLPDLRVGSLEVMRGEQVRGSLHRSLVTVAWIIALVAGYAYLNYVLLLFPWTRALGLSLSTILLRPLATLGAGFLRFIPDLVFLIILALVARFTIRLSRSFLRRVGSGAITVKGFEPEWARPTERIVRLLVIVFALVIAYPYIPGSGSEAFKGIGLILGLMFSLGSPSLIGNMVAGFSIAFRRAFRVGDRVRIGEHVGDVMQMRLLTTYLRSPKNEQIVIPNSLILNSEVVNFSTFASDAGLVLHTSVRISYEIPWRQVEAMLLEAARRTPKLSAQPEPFVHQRALGDFAVDYEINAYCDDPHAMLSLYTALHRNILDMFNEYGVQIMTPAYEGDPERPKIVPRERWFASPARPDGMERVVEQAIPTNPVDVGLPTRHDGESTHNRP